MQPKPFVLLLVVVSCVDWQMTCSEPHLGQRIKFSSMISKWNGIVILGLLY